MPDSCDHPTRCYYLLVKLTETFYECTRDSTPLFSLDTECAKLFNSPQDAAVFLYHRDDKFDPFHDSRHLLEIEIPTFKCRGVSIPEVCFKDKVAQDG